MGEAAEQTVPGLGARLRAAREARGLGREQLARELHLEESGVTALEEEHYAALGAPVFVRGHLRTYARVVGLAEAEVLEAYAASDPRSRVPPRIAREVEQPLNERPGPLSVAAIIAAVVVGGAVFWALSDPPAGNPPAVPRVAEPGTGSMLPDVAPSAPVAVPAAPVEGVPAGDPPGSLVLEFTAVSWVDIRDARGRLLAGEQPAGSRQVLTGEPPFDLEIGNSEGVRIVYDGESWSIPDGARRSDSNVARFRIGRPAE